MKTLFVALALFWTLSGNSIAQPAPPAQPADPSGKLSVRIVSTGRKDIASKPQELDTALLVGITRGEIISNGVIYEQRRRLGKLDQVKKLSVTATATVDATVFFNGEKVGDVAANGQFSRLVVYFGKGDYNVELRAKSGATLDEEGNLKKTGL